LRYGHYDASTNSKFEIEALALGSKQLYGWVVEQLSETVDMAPRDIAFEISILLGE
jgi:hypothetical protein